MCVQVFKQWLESLQSSLNAEPLKDPGENLAAAVFILLCSGFIYRDFSHLKKVFVEGLARTLVLNPDLDSKKCPEYDFLLNVLPQQTRYIVIVML